MWKSERAHGEWAERIIIITIKKGNKINSRVNSQVIEAPRAAHQQQQQQVCGGCYMSFYLSVEIWKWKTHVSSCSTVSTDIIRCEIVRSPRKTNKIKKHTHTSVLEFIRQVYGGSRYTIRELHIKYGVQLMISIPCFSPYAPMIITARIPRCTYQSHPSSKLS